jgi:O-antigen ligase
LLHLAPPEVLLLGVGGLCITCWALVISLRLAAANAGRVNLVPATLLAVAVFLPTAATIVVDGRPSLADNTPLIRLTIGLYLLGVLTTLLCAPRVTRGGDTRILWLALLYWVTAAAAEFNAGLKLVWLSFLVVPIIFIVSWHYRPSYRDALTLLRWVSLGICGGSLLLAIFNPSAAFSDAARVVHILSNEQLFGVVTHHNLLGLVAATGVVVWWQREGWPRVLGVSVCGLALAASDSRTAWFACAAGVMVLVLGRRQQTHRLSLGRLIAGMSLLALIAVSILVFADPTEQQGPVTFTGRTEVWQFVGQHWAESPILGHGPGVATGFTSPFGLQDWFRVGHAHNQFLESLYTTGLVGVGLLILLIWYWTAANLRSARAGYLMPLALEAMILAYGLFESPLSLSALDPALWLFAILLPLQPVSTEPEPIATYQPSRVAPRTAAVAPRYLG